MLKQAKNYISKWLLRSLGAFHQCALVAVAALGVCLTACHSRLGLLCGTMGYLGTALFVRKIYGTVKID